MNEGNNIFFVRVFMSVERVLDIVPYQNFKDPPLPHTHSKLVSEKPGLGWQNLKKNSDTQIGFFLKKINIQNTHSLLHQTLTC